MTITAAAKAHLEALAKQPKVEKKAQNGVVETKTTTKRKPAKKKTVKKED